MPAPGDLGQLLTVLSASGARYLVAGGVAVVLHGHPRFTADLDLVVKLDPHDLNAALAALQGLGYRPRAPVEASAFADPEQRRAWVSDKGMRVFSMWSPRFPATDVDLFAEEPFDFDEAYARATRVYLEDAEVMVVSIADLIDLKRAAGRAKDLEDVRELEAIAERLRRGH